GPRMIESTSPVLATTALCAGDSESVFHFWTSLSLHHGTHAGRNLQVHGGWLSSPLSNDDNLS
ncbi:hypothetical protein, partial [Acinetobacter towneri]|uniref:hypothetical protein n=1 Tax=Acinetobacter towneri TaxID=202956 RepID=UPI0034D4D1AF